jgi:enoyl-CoA hydratase
MDYKDFRSLDFDRDGGVLLITIARPDRLNAVDEQLHLELGEVWNTVAHDESVRCALITGAGQAFSAGGDMRMIRDHVGNYHKTTRLRREAAAIVYNMINCPQPIVSAINGPAVGAGLAVALLADVSVASETAKLSDGHLRLGVAAGDHAAIIWPLLCGMAKAKYHLLTAGTLDGREAERIGLVSLCVPQQDVYSRALDVARGLASGPSDALRLTKYALNNWLRMSGPILDTSLAFEMLTFHGNDIGEGLEAFQQKRSPRFAAPPTRSSQC